MFSQTTFPEETIAPGVFIAKFNHALAKHDGIDNQSHDGDIQYHDGDDQFNDGDYQDHGGGDIGE